MNKYEKEAKKINPNLKLYTYYLDKDFGGFKKGNIYLNEILMQYKVVFFHKKFRNKQKVLR